MEVFNGDRQIPLSEAVGFLPFNLTPFTRTTTNGGDVLSDNRTAEMQPPPQHFVYSPQPLPPQKLRPIRSCGRNLTKYVTDYRRNGGGRGGVDGSGGGVASSTELGFLTQLSKQKSRPWLEVGGLDHDRVAAPTYPFGSTAVPGSRVGGNDGTLAGINCSPAVDNPTSALHFRNVVMDAANVERLETELSSSSDDDNESSEAEKEPLFRKRKRKTRKKLELFLENMIRKVIQKQEQMHNQMVEMLERKEKERIIREEAWKQQQIERAKRMEKVRAQEASRCLALISFIKNMLGHEIQIPKSLESSCPVKDEGENKKQENFNFHPSSSRWPTSEVQALITVRTALDHKFLGSRGSVWEEVASGLSKMGFTRTARRCKEKWENINKYYRRTMEGGKTCPDSNKSCQNFHELDILYKSRLITSGNAFDYTKKEAEKKSLKDQNSDNSKSDSQRLLQCQGP